MLPTDWAAPASSVRRRLSDGRVHQYWDPHHLLAMQMKKDARAPQPEQDCCIRSGILWDLVAVYPPGSVWSDRMPTATVFTGPVVDVTEEIQDAVTPGHARPRTDSTAAPSLEPSRSRHLDGLLTSLGLAAGYEVVDQHTLLESDLRRGYPAPTFLYPRDIFAMSVPKPPVRDPT